MVASSVVVRAVDVAVRRSSGLDSHCYPSYSSLTVTSNVRYRGMRVQVVRFSVQPGSPNRAIHGLATALDYSSGRRVSGVLMQYSKTFDFSQYM